MVEGGLERLKSAWLYIVLYPSQLGHEPSSEDGSDLEQTRRLATAMGHITILKKGKADIISNGHEGQSAAAACKLTKWLHVHVTNLQ